MKYTNSIIPGLLIVCFIGIFPVESFSQAASVKSSKGHVVKDSISYLDSLFLVNEMINPEISLSLARKAVKYARKFNKAEDLVRAYTILGVAFSKNNKDSSFYYDIKALRMADSAKVHHHMPNLLYNYATLHYITKNYKEAIVYMDSCIKVSGIEKDYTYMSQALNDMGNINYDINDMGTALRMYDSAYKIALQHSIYKNMGISLGNIARFENDQVKAFIMNKQAIGYLKRSKESEDGLSRIFINMGNRTTNPDTALYYFNEALKIGQNNHLAEVEIGAYNDMVYSYLEKGDIKGAETCLADHAIPLATMEENDDWLSSLYDTYADVLGKKGDFKEAAKWQKEALKKRKSVDNSQAAEQVRLLGVLLDLKGKELTIKDNKQEILLQQNRLQKTQLGLTITIFMIIGFVFIILWLQQRNRVKLQVQQIQSAKRVIEIEENEKQKIARELHDITGQLVLGITGEIENLEISEIGVKEEIKGKIKELGKSIRLISHRMNKAMLDNFTFEELILGQCEDIKKAVGLQVQLEMPLEPLVISEEVVLHAYRIVQELLTNAGKYARESYVSMVFQKTDTEMIINYSDNGPGFDSVLIEKKGMGLMNIFERAKLVNGSAKLTTSPGDGTSWEIKFPLVLGKSKTA